jgi:nucleoside 2-deoxyribosyltransferase
VITSGSESIHSLVVYLAGPEVFLPEALELGKKKTEICNMYDFEARFPLDVVPDPDEIDPSSVAISIFDVCVAMMDTCDLLIANMTPFRGISMDVGTAVELGYMHAKGKPVFGYTNVEADYATRVSDAGLSDELQLVENYGLFDNLMCDGPVRRSGGEVVRYAVPGSELLTSLEGFELCVKQARRIINVS